MSYLRIKNGKIIEAPYKVERSGRIIFGYNKENNEAMMFEDGFEKFPKSIGNYTIQNGEIVERQIEPIAPNSMFSKLQIRRAMRELGIENVLDQILENNEQFKKDWNDAQEIDLQDDMIQSAIQSGLISQSMVDQIKRIL